MKISNPLLWLFILVFLYFGSAVNAVVEVEIFEVYGTVYADVYAQQTARGTGESIRVTVSYEGLRDEAITIEEYVVTEEGIYQRYELGEASEFGRGRGATVTVEELSSNNGEPDRESVSWP